MKNENTTAAAEAMAEPNMNPAAPAILKKLLKPGATVYTILRRVGRGGMGRDVSLHVIDDYNGEPYVYDITAAVASFFKCKTRDSGGIFVGGCGSDAGFDTVYRLGSAMWPNGTAAPHGTRNGEPDRAGGYALKHRWL